MRLFINSALHQILLVIKSTEMGWANHVAHIGVKINAYRILVENLRGDFECRWGIILECILNK
jgi:hypothetical protein